MFDSATLKLFAAITLFMGVTVLLRDRLAALRLAGWQPGRMLAQFIAALVGLAISVGFLYAVG
jgi:hypothetical protein